ncbi:MAG: hypothetical protein WCW62_09135 [Bacteroidales bacterium]
MKKFIVIAVMLIAALSAYPQNKRTSTETRNEKVKKQEAVQQSRQAATQQKQQATQARQQQATQAKQQQQQQQQQQNANEARQKQQQANDNQARQQQQQNANQARQKQQQVNDNQARQQQQNANQAKQQQQQQQKQQQENANQARQKQQQVNENQARQQQQNANQAKQQQQNANQARQKQQQVNENQARQQQVNQNRTTQSQNGRVARDNNAAENQKRINDNNQQVARTKTQAAATRVARPTDPAPVRIKDSEANRNFKQGNGTFTRNDGRVINHQNDQIFAKSRYRIDYDNSVSLRASADFRVNYRDYNNWYDDRYIRPMRYDQGYQPVSFEIRRERYMYRQPMHYSLVWTPYLFNRFQYYYPDQTYWDFEYGNEIETIPAYQASDYAGSVRRIYGRVDEVYYSRDDDTYILYIGDQFPYQDLSVIIPRHIAVTITGNPIRYFQHQYVWLIGLIDWWDEKPEVIIRDEQQIRRY